jgi:Calcineurin-like phosphoesterase
MRFQILSDLHLEVGQQYRTFLISVHAPNLILAGDIGRLQDYEPLLHFLERQCANFERVFYVLGNHEFYGVSHDEGLQLADKLSQEACLQGHLHLLNRSRVDIPTNISVIGCTLQSRISTASRSIVQSRINDFTRISNWTVDDHNAEHERDVAWLREEIRKIRDREDGEKGEHKIIVITHHAPIRKGSSRPEHEENPWSDAFATELLDPHPDLTGCEESAETNVLREVSWWVFGHTHFTTSCTRENVRLVSNQRGYVFPWQRAEQGHVKRKGKEGNDEEVEVKVEKRVVGMGIGKLLSMFAFRKDRDGKKDKVTTVSAPVHIRDDNFDVGRCIEV